MKSESHKATKFVAIAHHHNHPSTEQDVENVEVKSVSLSPTTTIAEVFAAFWPDDDEALSQFSFRPPFRIEIVPDEATIPENPVLKSMREGDAF